MSYPKVVLATLVMLAIVVSTAGCSIEDNPCTYPMPIGGTTYFFDEDDGTQVIVDGQEAHCEDGHAVLD